MTLTRSEILSAVDLPSEEVAVPEWGGSVMVRGMTGTERDRFEIASYLAREDLEGKAVVRARVVAWCTLDADGKQLFTRSDLEHLGAKSGVALDRIFTVAQRLSAVTKDAPAAAERDFTDGPSGSSTSGSGGTSGSPLVSSSPDAPPPSSPNGQPTSGSPGPLALSAPTS